MRLPRTSFGVVASIAGALLFLAPPGLLGQQTGAINGQVVAQNTGRPLDGVQVYIPDTGIGTLTDQDGRYRLQEVPVGETLVRAQIIGHRSEEATVNVAAGQAATADFELQERAIALDEIVVTGPAGAAVEKKRLGNTIATIDMSRIENAPTQSVSEILQGREPGVISMPGSGFAGEGSKLRIRGSASLSQSNEPIVYVDGVRVNNGGEFGGNVSAGDDGIGASSRLDDIDPNSIERIEILKGAAAATLYGTEASNGVIQIFTKSGDQGAPRWSFEFQQGFEKVPEGRLIPHSEFGVSQEELTRIQNRWGVSVAPYEVFDLDLLPQALETGRTTNAAGQVSGGATGITYFASGRYANLDGPFGFEDLGPARDHNERVGATVNLNIFPLDALQLQIRSRYNFTHQEAPQDANNIYGVWPNMFHSQPRLASETNLFGQPAFATVRETMQQVTQADIERFGGSAGFTWRPTEALSVDGTFGLDITSSTASENVPFGWNVDGFTTRAVNGTRDVADVQHNEITADLNFGWQEEFGSDWSSSLTVGGQVFTTKDVQTGGTGENFAGPGLEVASAAASQLVLEQFLEQGQVGVFGQEQIGFKDFVFLTVGGRLDANSAFGEDFSSQFYPKASISLIPSDFPQWESDAVSTLRVRAAIGRSGLQPGAFDKFTTFRSLNTPEGAGVRPDNLGNQELKPEVSTEWEVGAEVGVLDDRLALQVTYWDRVVRDALVNRQFPVSGGFVSRQLVNIGESTAHGLDIGLNGNILSSSDLSIDFFANGAFLREEVTDLGGAPPIKVGGTYARDRNFVREGYAPASFFGAMLDPSAEIPLDLGLNCQESSREEALAYFAQPRTLDEFEVLAIGCRPGGSASLDNFIGKPLPDWQGAFGLDVTFLRNFDLYSLFEYKAGNFFIQDLSGAFRQSHPAIGRNTPPTARIDAVMRNPASSAEDRLNAALTWANQYRALQPMSGLNQIWNADFVRFRELSLTYNAPTSVAGFFKARSMALSFKTRNLFLWVHDDYTGLDPELNSNARCTNTATPDCNFQIGQEAWRVPLPRRFVFSVRMGF